MNLVVKSDEALQRTLIEARAIFADGRASIACQIQYFSITGARLALAATALLPEQFLLEVPARNKTYRAELRWRSRDAAGVRFVAEAAQSASPTAEELRAENADLRRRNAEMAAQLAALGCLATDLDPARGWKRPPALVED